MPNYVELGEVALALSRELAPKIAADTSALLSREVTTLLQSGAPLSEGTLSGLSRVLTTQATVDLPIVSRTLGLKVGEDAGAKIVFGRERLPGAANAYKLHVYEPHRNITIHPDGSFTVAGPTPSGETLMSRNFNLKGAYAEADTDMKYADATKHRYSHISEGEEVRSQVLTTGTSRQFHMTPATGDRHLKNLTPSSDVVDLIKETKPVQFRDDHFNQLLGKTVRNPRHIGTLAGFDKRTGEAMVDLKMLRSPYFEWGNADQYVQNLDGLYPITLNGSSARFPALRNAAGQVFQAMETQTGFRLLTAPDLYAFTPSEIAVEGQSVYRILDLNPNAGLRALGGFSTKTGGRIPITVTGH